MYKTDGLVDVEVDLADDVIELLIENFDVMFPYKHSAVPLHMLAALPAEAYRQMKINCMLASAIKDGVGRIERDLEDGS